MYNYEKNIRAVEQMAHSREREDYLQLSVASNLVPAEPLS